MNDAAVALGSQRDRHAEVGKGVMGKGLAVILGHPAVQELAAVMETPGDDEQEPYAREHQGAAPAPAQRCVADGRPSGPVLDIGASRPLPPSELEYRATRSSGPGGQHVNTSSTRVELTFDLEGSPTLTDAERELARRRLRSRLDADGRLRVVAQDERSQYRNRRLATERFCTLMRSALAPPPPPRRPSRPTRAAQGGAARGQAPRLHAQAAAAPARGCRRPGGGAAWGCLSGRRVLVTGGGSGIGAAIVRRFAAEGATVWAMGRRREQLEQVSERVVPGDVADPR